MTGAVGDLKVRILIDILQAIKDLKGFGSSLGDADQSVNKLKKSSVELSEKLSRVGFIMYSFREAGSALKSAVAPFVSLISSSKSAYDAYISSTRQLGAASKLTGANLDELKQISRETKSQFELSADQSNSFTIELTKLGQKAGDISKVKDSIGALLDLGAGQGLSSEQTLYAMKQAILGIDEGTDKLFQKNPSVLYDEYAKKIGTTAGKLTDQQKALALLNAVMDSGNKLNGEYSKYLDSAPGKQQKLNNEINDAKIKFGEQLAPAISSVLDYANRLLSAFNGLDQSTKTILVTFGLLSIGLTKLIPLFSSLVTTFPRVGVAANSAAGSIARAFGSGGPVAIAIGLTLIWLSQLIDKISEAQQQAEQLERYKKRLSEGTFVNLYDPNNPDDKAILDFERILEKDPNAQVHVEGKDIRLDEHVKSLKEARETNRKFGQSWEDMTGQVESSVKLQRESYDALSQSLQELDAKLKTMSPDDPALLDTRAYRDKIAAEKKEVEDLINPPTKSGSTSSSTSKKTEVLHEYDRLLKEIKDKENDLAIAQSGNHKGLVKDLREELKLLSEKKTYYETGYRSIRETLSELPIQDQLESIREKLLSRMKEIAENQKAIDVDIQARKIGIINDEFNRRKAVIEQNYVLELARISELKDATAEQIKTLTELAKKQKEIDLKNLNNDIAVSNSNKIKSNYDGILADLNASYNVVMLIANKMDGAGKNFMHYFAAALQAAMQAVNLINKSNSKKGIGIGDILGTIGSILPFFLSTGGTVPGSGAGDTVPAMLTPGEFVINKQSASKFGPAILQMLNKGVLPSPVSPMIFVKPSSDSAPIIIHASGELTDHLKWKIVDGGSRMRSIRITKGKL